MVGYTLDAFPPSNHIINVSRLVLLETMIYGGVTKSSGTTRSFKCVDASRMLEVRVSAQPCEAKTTRYCHFQEKPIPCWQCIISSRFQSMVLGQNAGYWLESKDEHKRWWTVALLCYDVHYVHSVAGIWVLTLFRYGKSTMRLGSRIKRDWFSTGRSSPPGVTTWQKGHLLSRMHTLRDTPILQEIRSNQPWFPRSNSVFWNPLS